MPRIMLIMLLFTLFVADAGAEEDPRLVTVSGSGEILTEPDIAVVGIGVEERASTVDEARRRVNETVTAVLALTRRQGIPEEQVASAALIVRPDYQWLPESRQQKLLGYVVTRRMSIRLTDISELGELFEGVLKLGINQVDPPVFDTARRAGLERQALAAAATDARARATVLADALGMKLGPVHRIDAIGGPVVQPLRERGMATAMASADEGGSYQAGEIRIVSSVNASFELVGP